MFGVALVRQPLCPFTCLHGKAEAGGSAVNTPWNRTEQVLTEMTGGGGSEHRLIQYSNHSHRADVFASQLTFHLIFMLKIKNGWMET